MHTVYIFPREVKDFYEVGLGPSKPLTTLEDGDKVNLGQRYRGFSGVLMDTFLRSRAKGISLLHLSLLLVGCERFFLRLSQPLFTDLSTAFLAQRDPALVREGLPAYLILLDGLIDGNPHNKDLLLTAARAYSAYSMAFVEEEKRRRLFAEKARDYAFRALELHRRGFFRAKDGPHQDFLAYLSSFRRGDVPYLFHTASIWAGWIEANSDSVDALADLPKVKAMVERVLEIDETYYYGAAHAFMGVLLSIYPPSLGGRPEEGRTHFERAIEIGKGRYIPTYVMYARYYAKPLYRRDLFFSLLKRARSLPVDKVPELTLINTLARDEAERLMEEALNEGYFD